MSGATERVPGWRGLLILRALATARGAVSTAEIADACFTGPSRAVSRPREQAWRVLRRLAESGKAEVAGEESRHGNGGPVLTWRITDAGRAQLHQSGVSVVRPA